MFELSRRLEFSAAHRLWCDRLSDDENRRLYGPCANLHGHNYVLDVTVRGDVDPVTGMVMDLNVIAQVLDEVLFRAIDHRNLESDVPWLAGKVTTAENVVAAMWEQLRPHLGPGLHRMRLYESPQNFVDYSGPGAA
ncbi:MAG: 6-carboxytetrahydropterin synthase [Planctomycetes bacterium]|nr:6-carboxytetrahydropterin synthase [Planctomycetota bacterium]